MTITDLRKLTIIARAKLSKLTQHCSPGCPGWAVFECSKGGLEIGACYECWLSDPFTPDFLLDHEAAAMPEARKLLLDEHERTGVPLSVWQRSLGHTDLPKLTKAEAAQLKRELAAGRRRMEKRGEA